MDDQIYKAPPNSGQVILGRTVPSLLDEGCVSEAIRDRELALPNKARDPHPQTLYQWAEKGWQSLSNQDFRRESEELALGLLALGLEKGDRVSLFMYSNINFCIADMGCLIANLVDVPIHLTEASEAITFIWQHTEAKALIISNLQLLHQVAPNLAQSDINIIVIAEVAPDWQENLPQLPAGKQVLTLAEIGGRGKAQLSENNRQELRDKIAPNDLATIIYTSGTTGQPKGVMLTHENISADILAVFTGIPEIASRDPYVVLSFLPMTHITARAFFYGHLSYGHSIYFTTPDQVFEHLKEVQPTGLMAVPRLLEKFYEKILENGSQVTGLRKMTFEWGLNLAKCYELGKKPGGFYALQLQIADLLVFSQWRAVLGGRIKCLFSGGAALKAEMANIFSAAGMTVLQGYGLTESASSLCANRGKFNRAGTVGTPLAGVEIAIAPDGEILARSPYITKGYHKNPEATKEAINENGWFHTGDIGEFTADGFLKITDRKKNLFKLSTGKYVTPQPLETKLKQSPLVEQAIAVGADRKFCGMLIFPNQDHVCLKALEMGLNLEIKELLQHPKIIALYQTLIDETNQGLPNWSTVKRFNLVNLPLTVDSGMLTPSLKVRRGKVCETLAAEIDFMYSQLSK